MKAKKILLAGLLMTTMLFTACGSKDSDEADSNLGQSENNSVAVEQKDTQSEPESASVTVVFDFDDADTATNTAKLGDYQIEGGDFIDTIEVPDGLEIEGFTINGLGLAFYGKSDVRKVVINNSAITEIPHDCFGNNSSVEEIDLKNITKVGEHAFSDCSSLKKVSFEEGLAEIEAPAFFSVETLEEVHLPASLDYDVNSFDEIFNYQVANELPFTIYTPAGSAAEAFGNAHDFITVVNE